MRMSSVSVFWPSLPLACLSSIALSVCFDGKLPIPVAWRHVMFWGGLRGALVMALALSLPLSFPERETIINMTFGVVLFKLLVPGLTMEPLLRVLKLEPARADKVK
jgi:NhaP-type Na+/H+ or K+/H+ antiporter